MKPRKLILLCYLAAAALWLVLGLAGVAAQLIYGQENLTLTGDDLTCLSFVPYAQMEWKQPPCDEDDPDWYLSTDGDPQMLWQSEEPRYVTRVVLYAEHYYAPGMVMLYYLKPGQTDYRESQKVIARVSQEGEYTFDLRGIRVSGLRIDPDSCGGVPTLFHGVELKATPLYDNLIPGGFQWLALLFAPLAAAAVLALLGEIIPKGGR